MDIAAILARVNALPVDERILSAQAIWNSIPEEEFKPDLTDAQKADLDRRLADIRANPDNVLTWDEIKSRLGRGS